MGESSKWSLRRLIIGCVAAPTRTMLAAIVLPDRSVPPKRPSNAACRYSGSPSSNLDVAIQASAASLNNPLGMVCAGLRCQAQPPVPARACVLDALVADHAQLLRDDVELYARFHTDLHEGGAIMRTDATGAAELVAHNVPRQSRV